MCIIAGAGKTKLTSWVIDDLRMHLESSPNDEAISYFYCDRKEVGRREPSSILRALVKQLCLYKKQTHAIQLPVWDLYCRKRESSFASKDVSISESHEIMLQLTNIYPQTNIVIDALDECDRRTRMELIQVLHDLVRDSSKPVKIFISSREDEDISFRFNEGPNVGIRADDNQDDIVAFVNEKIEKNEKQRRRPLTIQTKGEIIQVIREQSKGMFRWAALQIDQLLVLDRKSDIEERLGRLPAGLKEAYDEIFQNIKNQEGSKPAIAFRALKWVMCCVNPPPEELLLAAAIQSPEEDSMWDVDVDAMFILDACRNLLVLDDAQGIWRFSHASVQEYMEMTQISLRDANAIVASICLRKLMDPGVNTKPNWETSLSNLMRVWQWLKWQDAQRNDGECSLDIDIWNPEDQVSSEDILKAIDASTYALLSLTEYALMYWSYHVWRIADRPIERGLKELLHSFFRSLSGISLVFGWWRRPVGSVMRLRAGTRLPDLLMMTSLLSNSELNPKALSPLSMEEMYSTWPGKPDPVPQERELGL